MKKKNRKIHDAQLEEFLSKDLGKDIERSGLGVIIRPKQKLTSIFLDPFLVAELRRRAERRGLRYQSLLKMIVYDHLKEY